MSIHVYNSKVAARELTSKNGLFVALALLEAYHTEEVQGCPTESRMKTLACYSSEENHFKLVKYMIDQIYTIMRARGISISKRKCRKYVATFKGQCIYIDTDITIFADIILSMIKDDLTLQLKLNRIMQYECHKRSTTSELGDCVDHLFGFQYENLKAIISKRRYKSSRKTKALQTCLNDMYVILNSMGYPITCERH